MRFRRMIRAGAVAGIAYMSLATVTTQVETVRASVPFTDDPWDAVTSFAVIAIWLIAAATIVRSLASARRPPEPDVERRIALGVAILAMITAAGVSSDITALVVVGVEVDGAVVAVLALLAVAAVSVAFALLEAWRRRADLLDITPRADEPDLIDDVGLIARSLGARSVAARVIRWVETSRFSPRRHRVVAGAVVAALAGLGAVIWHAIREGAWASPGAAALFGGLIALAVIGPYLLGLGPLRLVRSNS
jgi:hypothetical protein